MQQDISLFHQAARFACALVHRFHQAERGAVAVIVALAVVPLIVAGGLAVDLSRAYMVQARLSHALDAAGLAVGSMRTPSSTSTYLEAQFNNYFTANYAATDIGVAQGLTFVDNGGIITVTGQATVDTVFMKIVGIDSVTVASSSEIVVETKGLELVMVLDVTGSMSSGGKLSTMKGAAQDLIDILFGDETAPDLLKVGLVPFSSVVNIGTANSAYVTSTPWNWYGCAKARAYPADVVDTTMALDGYWDPYTSGSPCPQALTPLTNNRTLLENNIAALSASGNTHINIGAVWGWRVLSPGEPFTQGTAYGDPDWAKAAIILTDGYNTGSSKSAYGTSLSRSTLDSRLQQVCTGMKGQNISVYTITFGSGVDSSTATMMGNCATTADMYYHSPDNATLTHAFRAIGAELKNLHLSK